VPEAAPTQYPLKSAMEPGWSLLTGGSRASTKSMSDGILVVLRQPQLATHLNSRSGQVDHLLDGVR